MDIKETIKTVFQEMILPEFKIMKDTQQEIKLRIEAAEQRLSDINLHLIDQSRRIDETNKRIDSVKTETSEKIDHVRDELVQMINETNKRIDSVKTETSEKIDHVRDELVQMINETNKRIDEVLMRIDWTNKRIDETNIRIDKLCDALVKKEEHDKLAQKVAHLDVRLSNIEQKLAA